MNTPQSTHPAHRNDALLGCVAKSTASLGCTQPDRVDPTIYFAGGGTGGHIFPAIAIAESLRKQWPGARFVYFGTRRPLDRQILSQVDGEFVPQSIPRLSVRPWRWPGIVAALYSAFRQARRRICTDGPSMVVGTGGLASLPAVREAIRAGVATCILNPDAIPGRANRRLAGEVDAVFVQWSETRSYLSQSRRLEVLGCPVRESFLSDSRDEAYDFFGLDKNRKTLLVTGASQGARSINEAVVSDLRFLPSADPWQILHLTGEADYEFVRGAYKHSGAHVCVMPFTDRMGAAVRVADMVVSRAGASTLAELTAMGKPSVLMPYPYHRDQHQRENAKCLVRTGAAVIVEDQKIAGINGPVLRGALGSLMADASARESMSLSALQMGRPTAGADIANRIVALVDR